MLKEASTHLIIPEISEDLIVNEPWSIDIYADGLMNDIFADIDQILDVSGNITSQTRNLGYGSAQTVKMPQIVLPNQLNRTVQRVPQKRKPLSKVVVGTHGVKPVSRSPQTSNRALGKLLVVGSTVGVAIAGVIYLVHSGVLTLLTFTPTLPKLQVSQPQLPTKVDVEAELVDYMLGALAVIDRQQSRNNYSSANSGLAVAGTPNQTALAFANNQRSVILPPPLAANNTPPAPKSSTNIVERIYIPVYQAPSPMRYTPPVIPGVPKPISSVATATVSQPDTVKNALNSVQKAPKPVSVNMLAAAVRPELKPVAVRTAPITVGKSSKLLPAFPVVPFRSAPPQLSADTAPVAVAFQQQVTPPTTAAPSHTLEGLLELGSKSAALFKIEGVTQRFVVGERIGSSGWTLVDVSNGEAIIRRNGEVRSIYTGQKL
ncbi:MAG: hypothetical protein KME32_15065 [Mojavia pulchra JT2-VF2]|jgi:hypothetical protein|uniref:Type II secretion system protein GspC N-terminal domain-containing protein n=1 Tax=Mojavia pulchra JT2-VF2 TaxID=287848 RepID=A0A951PY71_9NOST|nr:hypothetical protein [Mojavia pulchra JT2-VF2]